MAPARALVVLDVDGWNIILLQCEEHTQLAKMIFDDILDLRSAVRVRFYFFKVNSTPNTTATFAQSVFPSANYPSVRVRAGIVPSCFPTAFPFFFFLILSFFLCLLRFVVACTFLFLARVLIAVDIAWPSHLGCVCNVSSLSRSLWPQSPSLCCSCCSHINSHNQVRGHRTGFSHSGAEENPREKTQTNQRWYRVG